MAPASSPTGPNWTLEEHQRFLEALVLYPNGPWKQRAEYVRTRTARQLMTHSQKLHLKRKRHARGLQKAGRPPGACQHPHVRRTTAHELATADETTRQVAARPALERMDSDLLNDVPRPTRRSPKTSAAQMSMSLPPCVEGGSRGIAETLQPLVEMPLHGDSLDTLWAADACDGALTDSPVSPDSAVSSLLDGDGSDDASLLALWDWLEETERFGGTL